MPEQKKNQKKEKKNISLDEEQKKAILDKVESSNEPVAKVLRNLGISRSTYYNWLNRYQSQGEAGLKDKRTGEETQESGPADSTRLRTPTGEATRKSGTEPSPDFVREAAVGQGAAEEMFKEEDKVSKPLEQKSETHSKPMETQKSSNFSVVATLGIIFVVAALIISLCMYNSSRYYIVQNGSEISLWKGKFAPFGKVMVQDFKSIKIGDLKLNPITDKTYYGEWSAVNALFTYMVDKADSALQKQDGADYVEANRFLALAEKVAYKGEQKNELNKRYAQLYYHIANKKMEQAEKQLLQVYNESIGVFSRSKELGISGKGSLQEDIDRLSRKAEELKLWTTDYNKSWLSQKTQALEKAPEPPLAPQVKVEKILPPPAKELKKEKAAAEKKAMAPAGKIMKEEKPAEAAKSPGAKEAAAVPQQAGKVKEEVKKAEKALPQQPVKNIQEETGKAEAPGKAEPKAEEQAKQVQQGAKAQSPAVTTD